MTLIYSYSYRGMTVGVGDILLSNEKPKGDVSVSIPSRGPNFCYKDEDIQLAGTCQKMHIFDDRHYVMWAGSYLYAKLAIKELDRLFKEKGVTGLEYLNQSRPDLYNEHFSLIFLSTDGDGNGLIERHCVNTQKYGDFELDVYGTGEYFFVYEAAEELQRANAKIPGYRLDSWHVIEKVVSGVASSFSKEFTVDSDFFKFGYGGWYDVMIHEAGFRKVPYAIKTWQRRKTGEILDLSLFSCFYVGPYLCVLRVSGESEKEQYFLNVVESILSQPPDGTFFDYIEHFQKPEMTIHLLNDQVYDQYPVWFDSREDHQTVDIDENGTPFKTFNKNEALRNLLKTAEELGPRRKKDA